MNVTGDGVKIVGCPVGFDADAPFDPESTNPSAVYTYPEDIRYELDPEAGEPCECLPVWDGEN